MRPCPALLLLAAALGAADAEPIPTTSTAAAMPEPAATVPEPAAPAGGAVTDPVAVSASDTLPGRARRAPAAATPDRWSFIARTALGYDSNPVLESSVAGDASGSDSAVWSAELASTLRLVRAERASLAATLGGEYVDYPSEREVSLLRVGGSLRGSIGVDAGGLGRIDPGAIVSAYGFWADGEHEATAVQGSLFATRIGQGWVGIASIGATGIDYPDDEDLSGTMLDGALRVMLLAKPGQIANRVELGLRGGTYAAESDSESYATLQPTLLATVRGGGERPAAGVVDLTGRLGYERRWYDETGTQRILTMSAGIDRWFSPAFAVGAVLAVTDRDASDDADSYGRVQVMTRAAYTW